MAGSPATGIGKGGCEALVSSFGDMTRAMESQCRALARKVSLVTILDESRGDEGGRDSRGYDDSDKENVKNTSMHQGNSAAEEAANKRVLSDLCSIDTILSNLEQRSATMREAIARERRGIAHLEELACASGHHTAKLATMCISLPQHLPCASPTKDPSLQSLAARSEEQCASTARPVAVAVPKPATSYANEQRRREAVEPPDTSHVELVTVRELEGVPRSTRARLTIAQVNAAITEVHNTVAKREAFVRKPRSKMTDKQLRRLDELEGQRLPAHAGEPFLAEADLRALPSFRKGEVTARALIATLRSLKRLKAVRGAGTMTYAVPRACKRRV